MSGKTRSDSRQEDQLSSCASLGGQEIQDPAVVRVCSQIRGVVMKIQGIIAATAIATVALFTTASAVQAASADVGAAVVKVQTEPAGIQGSFVFSGTPEGTTVAGGSLIRSGLAPGAHTTVEAGAPPNLVLVSIACDDGEGPTPSQGAVDARQATFNIDARELVTCVFLYRAAEMSESAGGAVPPPGGGSSGSFGGGGAGDVPAPGEGPNGTESVNCEAPALVPRAGTWNVSNHVGRMVCGSMFNMPLKASQETGILEIRDCGWTVIGTGLAEDTAPLTMHAVDATSGKYAGSVGGVQDGIPMTINFTWQTNSEEWVVGELSSVVTQQGMTCNMSRAFELKYAGP